MCQEYTQRISSLESQVQKLTQITEKVTLNCRDFHISKKNHLELLQEKTDALRQVQQELKLNDEQLKSMSQKLSALTLDQNQNILTASDGRRHHDIEGLKLNPVEERIKHLQNQLELKHQKCLLLKQKNEEFEKLRSSHIEEIKKFEAVSKSLRSQVQNLESRQSELQSENQEVLEALQSTKEHNLELEVHLETLKLDKNSLEIALKECMVSAEKLGQQLQNSTESNLETLERLKNLTIEKEGLLTAVKGLESKLVTSETSARQWQEKAETFRDLNSSLAADSKLKIDELKKQNTSLNSDLDAITQENSKLASECEDLQKKYENVKKQHKISVDEMVVLMQQVQALESKMSELKFSSKTKLVKIAQSMRAINLREQEVHQNFADLTSELQKKEIEMRKELGGFVTLFSNLHSKRIRSLASAFGEKVQSLELLKSKKLQNLTDNYERRLTECQQEKNELKQQLRAGAEKFKALQNELLEFQKVSEDSLTKLMHAFEGRVVNFLW